MLFGNSGRRAGDGARHSRTEPAADSIDRDSDSDGEARRDELDDRSHRRLSYLSVLGVSSHSTVMVLASWHEDEATTRHCSLQCDCTRCPAMCVSWGVFVPRRVAFWWPQRRLVSLRRPCILYIVSLNLTWGHSRRVLLL